MSTRGQVGRWGWGTPPSLCRRRWLSCPWPRPPAGCPPHPHTELQVCLSGQSSASLNRVTRSREVPALFLQLKDERKRITHLPDRRGRMPAEERREPAWWAKVTQGEGLGEQGPGGHSGRAQGPGPPRPSAASHWMAGTPRHGVHEARTAPQQAAGRRAQSRDGCHKPAGPTLPQQRMALLKPDPP